VRRGIGGWSSLPQVGDFKDIERKTPSTGLKIMNRLKMGPIWRLRNLKSKICLSIISLISLCAAFTLGYYSGYARARKGAVFSAVDAKDAVRQGPAEVGYDDYFTRANPIPAHRK
jgi:hypothetical protein